MTKGELTQIQVPFVDYLSPSPSSMYQLPSLNFTQHCDLLTPFSWIVMLDFSARPIVTYWVSVLYLKLSPFNVPSTNRITISLSGVISNSTQVIPKQMLVLEAIFNGFYIQKKVFVPWYRSKSLYQFSSGMKYIQKCF